MRIASLLASGTEIVCALGLEDQLVAISHECDFPMTVLDRPRASRPRFDPVGLTSGQIDGAVRAAMQQHGSVYELDVGVLRRAAPDLVLTQAVCEVCAVPTSLAEQAVRALGDGVAVLSLDAHSIEEILQAVVAVGVAAGLQARGEVVVESLRERMAAVRDRTAGVPEPTVLAIEWLEPVFVPGHWVPDMIRWARGTNLLGDVRRPSLQLSWEGLRGLDPDVLIVMPCGFGLEQARQAADQHAEQLLAVGERAIAGGRAFVVDGSSYFNRSGPRVADGVEILGRLLHPWRFPDIDLWDRAAVWRPGP
jgi:iron complex transport system substrate-binding protein